VAILKTLNLHPAFTKPSSNKQKSDTNFFYNQKCSQEETKQIKSIIERGYMIMKKFVSIILTTGLLMGTVAFGALACDRKGDGPDQFEGQKRMGQYERYQPPVKPRGHKDKVIVRVGVKKPGPVPAPRVRRPAPAQRHDHRLMPKPVPERDQRLMPKSDPERHDHNRRPVPEKLKWDRD
jgi:hypothetical protein